MRRTVPSLLCLVLLPLLLNCAGGWGRLQTAEDIEQILAQDHEVQFDVPVVVNEQTAKWIAYFQTKGRKHFKRHLERSYRYIPLMRGILREHDLPQDLVYIALIESGFNAKAYSRARAAGFWQFIASTGRRYGLKISPKIDERRDYVKSTDAAARYLKDLYALFGDWYLAAAAYNAGEGKVLRAIKRHRTKDFWKLATYRDLRRETKNYIPKYLAAMVIAKEPDKFGFSDLQPQQPLEYKEVEVKGQPLHLNVAAKLSESDLEMLKDLNPELSLPFTPENQKSYRLRVPLANANIFEKRFASLPRHMWMANKEHRVKAGESLKSLAESHKMSPQYFAMANGLKSTSKLIEGQLVGIPYKPPKQLSGYYAIGGKAQYHRVRSGDSLWKIARTYNVRLKDLKAWNRGRIGRYLKPGQTILVYGKGKQSGSKLASRNRVPRSSKDINYRVKSGDSLWSIAQAHGVSVSSLKDWNQGKIGRHLKPGQKILIKGSGAPIQIASSTSSSANSETTYYRVKSGDTLSTIAQRHGVSVTQLRSWNRGKLGRYLKPGQKLAIGNSTKKPAAIKVASRKSSQAKPPAAGGNNYLVKDGDSLWDIARRHNVTINDLKEWNRGTLGRHLKPGQSIAIYQPNKQKVASKPQPAVEPAMATEQGQTIYHTISSGDTLWDIARKYGVRTSDIKQWNGIEQVKRLRPGDKLKIYVKLGPSQKV